MKRSRRSESVIARTLCAAALVVAVIPHADADERDPIADDLHETVVAVPMTEHGLFGDHTRNIVATTYMPVGAGPFPLIVLSHGSPPNPHDRFKIGRYRKLAQIRQFVNLGFAVIVPIRRGYGATGGSYAEDIGSCQNPDFERAGRETAQDLLATIAFANTLPQVDPNKVVLVGQSAGGFASLAAASYAPKGLVAVVNFSGGRGGNPSRHPGAPCGPDKMAQTITHFASTTRVPVLWHYVENDQYFAPDVVKSWFAAFQSAGGHGEFVLEPQFGRDGHGMFAVDRSIPIWLPHVEQFLAPIVPLRQSTPPANSNS
ncbi:alpha/beta hydrolase family protein [Paraburkholderia sp. GAS199]|uniref:alpha/beta hydrolase family protein n=1 Tax=Paraburkholderia sp. GAS199 TaxID=3035126 RepID=UPI003D2259C0